MLKKDELKIGDRIFTNRLFIGTGKFSSNELMMKSIEASGSEVVTVALRRVDVDNPSVGIMGGLKGFKGLILPNTSGAKNASEAVRLARIGASLVGHQWVKLEVTPNQNHLLPDPVETFLAAEILAKEGFLVMPYMNADPVLAKRLEDVGCVCVMPLGSPIGTNQGIVTEKQIQIIINHATIPVIVDAGIGAPSHAAKAMEMGASAVLVNTAIATASDPVGMADAFCNVVIASRLAYCSGLPGQRIQASASSPLTGFLE